MKRRLVQILFCQLAAAALCTYFVWMVRTDYREALVTLGEEMGRMQTIKRLREAGSEIPGDLMGADKGAFVGPGIAEFAQNWFIILPMAILQGAAILLAASAFWQARESDTQPWE